VNEIDIITVLDALEQGTIGLRNLQLIPSDLRNFQTVLVCEAYDAAGKDSESGGATVELLTLLKQCLITDADPQKRLSRLNERARRFEQFLFSQRIDAIIKSSHTRQNNPTRVLHFFRLSGDFYVRADLE